MLLVFGSINMDIVIRVPRLPAPGETVLGEEAAQVAGGKGANQAHAAKLFGSDTQLVGAVGDDPFGAGALQLLRRSGVDLTRVHTLKGVASGLACIAIAASGENAITVAPGANARVRADWVDDGTIRGSRGLLLQGEVPWQESIALSHRFRERSRTVFMNPSPMPAEPPPAGLFDWLIVNATEMRQLCARLSIDAADPLTGGRRLVQLLQSELLITSGGEGAMIVHRDGRDVRCPALSGPALDAAWGPVVDTTGAGDTLAGVFAAALSQAYSPERALRYAVTASGLACRRHGTQAAQPARASMDAALAAWAAAGGAGPGI
jgi:ribokinase